MFFLVCPQLEVFSMSMSWPTKKKKSGTAPSIITLLKVKQGRQSFPTLSLFAPPKVRNLKIIGDLKEGSKITVIANVTGATEGSSRVQWFKTFPSVLDGENCLDALSTSKLAKAFCVPLGAVGYYIVAKFTPVNTDGESCEPAYVISGRAVETLPPYLIIQTGVIA